MRQPFSGMAERIFMKLLPNDRGEYSLKRRAAAWRKSRAPRTAVALYNHERANGCNLVITCISPSVLPVQSFDKSAV